MAEKMGARSGRAIRRSDIPSWIDVDKHGRIWTTHQRGPHKQLGPRRRADLVINDGYRKTYFHGSPVRAHRVVYAWVYGECPAGLMVLHRNGNPIDNRPENLAMGSAWDNAQDIKRHGSRPDNRGARHPLAKLTPAIVREMRRLYAEGVSRVEIAARFDHSYSHTGEIIARRAWTNVV